MYHGDFYKYLAEYINIEWGIVEKALASFDAAELEDLWNLFTNGGITDKMPYFKGGFYPDRFYNAIYKKAKSEDVSCNELFLYVYIALAKKSHDLYRRIKLSDEIFFDSFKRIGEDAREYLKETGNTGIYDYHFIANHVRGSVIRLGAFEYGYGKYCGKKAIYVHVPQNACMSRPERENSYALARKCFGKHPIIADSWLLYPEHKNMLSEDSSILDFISDFNIVSVNESHDYKELFHIFGRGADYSNPSNLPEDTLLQKMYVRRIKEKQPIGSAVGVLKI